ncbi:MAG: LysR family transcriptional regulator [Rhizobiales bacterium]|nr:LysR family transcriptional regulator [Hyphomicrobiales bacterium]
MAGRTYSLFHQRLRMRQLRVAVAVADHGSVLKASRALGMTQPATTRSLLELEDFLGLRLFDRGPRGMVLTRQGDVIVRRARRVLAEVDSIPDDIALMEKGLSEAVSIGVLISASSGLLPRVLARFRQQHPDILVSVSEGRMHDLLAQLAGGTVDLVLGRLYDLPTPDEFVREPLYHEPLAIVARSGHPVFLRSHVDAAYLRQAPFLLPTLGQRIGQDVELALRETGLHLETAPIRASSTSFIREMLFATDYLTVLSRLTLVGDFVRGGLRLLPFPIVTGPRPGGIILRPGPAVPPAVRALRGVVELCISELISTGMLAPYEPTVRRRGRSGAPPDA